MVIDWCGDFYFIIKGDLGLFVELDHICLFNATNIIVWFETPLKALIDYVLFGRTLTK